MRYLSVSMSVFCLAVLTHSPLTYGQTSIDADTRCGTILRPPWEYGPFDFRKNKDKLPVVENNHFTRDVELLIRGKTATAPGPDIAFTLRAIPNHPHALMSMMLLGEREKTDKPTGSQYTVDCWFERGIRFRPDDNVVRMLYTTYLTKANRPVDARQQLDILLATAKDNPFTHNNIGLLYFDLGDYEKALVQAHKATELGLDRPALRERLQSVGKWVEFKASDSTAGNATSPALASSAPKAP